MTTRQKRRPLLVLAALSLTTSTLFTATGGAVEAASTQLTNNCSVSPRGVPGCGAYTGGAYGSNTDVAAWESSAGPLGIRRTYFSAGAVSNAVNTAKADIAKKRLPWISFKLPYSWKDMAAGKGDAWAKDIAVKLKAVDGPVWLAFHHEPENDGGDIRDWTAMQARLGPIVRNNASNVAFTIILMGWHQFYGDSRFRLENMWPKTTVDVAGFDIYERYGVVKNGTTDTKWTDFKNEYFIKLQDWSKTKGVPWALAETGYSDPAAKAKPNWIQQTYGLMKQYGGIAFAYFNTETNAYAHWLLKTSAEQSDFAAINKTAPRLK